MHPFWIHICEHFFDLEIIFECMIFEGGPGLRAG